MRISGPDNHKGDEGKGNKERKIGSHRKAISRHCTRDKESPCIIPIRAMKNGGRIKISANPPYPPLVKGGEGGLVDIIIKDTGAGISETDLQKIFDTLFTTKREAKCLGLFTVQK